MFIKRNGSFTAQGWYLDNGGTKQPYTSPMCDLPCLAVRDLINFLKRKEFIATNQSAHCKASRGVLSQLPYIIHGEPFQALFERETAAFRVGGGFDVLFCNVDGCRSFRFSSRGKFASIECNSHCSFARGQFFDSHFERMFRARVTVLRESAGLPANGTIFTGFDTILKIDGVATGRKADNSAQRADFSNGDFRRGVWCSENDQDGHIGVRDYPEEDEFMKFWRVKENAEAHFKCLRYTRLYYDGNDRNARPTAAQIDYIASKYVYFERSNHNNAEHLDPGHHELHYIDYDVANIHVEYMLRELERRRVTNVKVVLHNTSAVARRGTTTLRGRRN